MKGTICIIDDDDDIRAVLEFALESENIPFLTFANCIQAEAHLSKLPKAEFPCLIFIDYMMPTMNGMEFISLLNLKYPETLAKIPMVLSTGLISEEIENLPPNILKLEKPIELQDFLGLAKEYSQI